MPAAIFRVRWVSRFFSRRLAIYALVAMMVAAVGLGLVLAAVMTRFAASMFTGVGAKDPVIFTAVGVAVLLVIVVASVLPARRASALDPISALRTE